MVDIKNIDEMLKLNIITKDEYDTIISRLKKPKDVYDYIWKDIIDGYYDYCCDKYTIVTAKGYRTCVMKFIMYLIGVNDYDNALNAEFKTFTFRKVNMFMQWLSDDGLSSHTINKIKYALIVLCDYLRSICIDSPDITGIDVKVDDKSNKIIPLLSQNEIYDIANCVDTRSKLCILLCYECALKRQEVSKVRFDDFDYSKNILKLYDDNNKFSRACVLNDEIMELVKNHKDTLYADIAKWNKSRIKKGKPVREDYGYIFQNIKTSIPSYPSLQTLLKNAARHYYSRKGYEGNDLKYKVGNFTFETLRNSKRLYLLSNGYTVNQVMNIIGDKNYMSTCRFQKFVPVFYPDSL